VEAGSVEEQPMKCIEVRWGRVNLSELEVEVEAEGSMYTTRLARSKLKWTEVGSRSGEGEGTKHENTMSSCWPAFGTQPLGVRLLLRRHF